MHLTCFPFNSESECGNRARCSTGTYKSLADEGRAGDESGNGVSRHQSAPRSPMSPQKAPAKPQACVGPKGLNGPLTHHKEHHTGPAPKPASGRATVASICLSLQRLLAAWRVAWLQVASCLIGEGPQDQDWGGSAEQQGPAPGCVDVAPRQSPESVPPELTLALCQRFRSPTTSYWSPAPVLGTTRRFHQSTGERHRPRDHPPLPAAGTPA